MTLIDTKKFVLTAVLIASTTTGFSQILFSSYVEGSGNNKALEIKNTGSDTLILDNYRIELYANGSHRKAFHQNLSGPIAPGDTRVIVHPLASDALKAISTQHSLVTSFDGNDLLLLKKGDSVVDRIGQLGNPVTYGANVTLLRKPSITQGDTDADRPFNAATQWALRPADWFLFSDRQEQRTRSTHPDKHCNEHATLISAVQGTQDASPYVNKEVVIDAVVTHTLNGVGQSKGFYLQEEDQEIDTDPRTSEGIFVYHNNHRVSVGDRVRVRGVVTEFYNTTQISRVKTLVNCATDQPLPTAIDVSLPLDSPSALEAVEGMVVRFNQTLTVNDVYSLGRYGEFSVGNGRNFSPTEVALPGSEATILANQNRLNTLIVDDGNPEKHPTNLPFPVHSSTRYSSLRAGTTINQLTGVITYHYGAYKLIPTVHPKFIDTNPRTLQPQAIPNSQLRVASFNLLNYFNGDGLGGGFPTARGADSPAEFQRQTLKLVAALSAMDADILALVELENDGFDAHSAIGSLVTALNTDQPLSKHYRFVSANRQELGRGAIAVGLLYRPSQVTPP